MVVVFYIENWANSNVVKLVNVPKYSLRRDVERLIKELGDFKFETPFPVLSENSFQNYRGEWIVKFESEAEAKAFAESMEKKRAQVTEWNVYVRSIASTAGEKYRLPYADPGKFYLLVKNIPQDPKGLANLKSRISQNLKYKIVSQKDPKNKRQSQVNNFWVLEIENEADCIQMSVVLDGNRFSDANEMPVRSEVILI